MVSATAVGTSPPTFASCVSEGSLVTFTKSSLMKPPAATE